MTITANQQQNEPQARGSIRRRVLCGVCVVAALFSGFFATHGLLMTRRLLNDEVPPGRIESILGRTKAGPRLRLDNGQEDVFLDVVLFQQPQPVHLAVGDHVEKQRGSLVYVVNGTALTDVRWVLRNWLLPVRVLAPLAAYLFVGAGYVLAYGRTPFGDLVWSHVEQRPRRPRTRGGMILAVFASWVVVALLLTTVFGCITGCLSGVAKALGG